MRQGKIVCEHCGSAKIVRDPSMTHAIVQEISQETGKPIGCPKTFVIFKCLSCGEGAHLEKCEVLTYDRARSIVSLLIANR